MGPSSAAVPDGVELVDKEDPPAPSPATRAPWWAWLAFVVAVASVLTVVADRRSGGDGSGHDPQPSGLAIFELDEIDLADATPRAETTFPLFGRRWDLALVVLQRNSVVAVDLDTGIARVIAELEDEAADAAIIGSIVVDDSIHLLGGRGEVFRVRDGAVETVRPKVDGSWWMQPSGGAYIAMTDLNGRPPNTSILSVASGIEVDAPASRSFAGVDGVLLLPRAETIVGNNGAGETSTWATGEILLAGTTSVAWWTCRSPSGSECRAWAGDEEEPRLVALDAETTRGVASAWANQRFGGPLVPPTVLSPDGRLAWTVIFGDDPFHRREIQLTDLADGRRAMILGADSDVVFTPSGAAIGVNDGVIPTIVDLTSGELTRIRLIDNAGAPVSNTMAFLPIDEVPG